MCIANQKSLFIPSAQTVEGLFQTFYGGGATTNCALDTVKSRGLLLATTGQVNNSALNGGPIRSLMNTSFEKGYYSGPRLIECQV
jgi:hypothetical protein